jgi:hypothetical protein
MTRLAVAAGSSYPDLGTTNNGALLPTIWSAQCTVKHYGTVIGPEIANSNWEGEIKSMGEKVIIPRTPTVTVIDGEKDIDLVTAGLYETPTKPAVELEINKREIYAVQVEDVDAFQSNINYLDRCAEDAVKQVAIRQDTKLLASIYGQLAATNLGNDAGPNADADLGEPNAAVVITTANALNFIMRMKRVLTELSVSKDNLKCVIGPRFAQILKNTDLKSALVTGDSEGVIRNGRLGSIDGIMFYESIYLPTFEENYGTAEYVYLVHPDGLTWASQYTQAEMIRRETKFASAVRGQVLWGTKVVESTYIAAGYVTYDASAL